jgi:hypothetical protein
MRYFSCIFESQGYLDNLVLIETVKNRYKIKYYEIMTIELKIVGRKKGQEPSPQISSVQWQGLLPQGVARGDPLIEIYYNDRIFSELCKEKVTNCQKMLPGMFPKTVILYHWCPFAFIRG